MPLSSQSKGGEMALHDLVEIPCIETVIQLSSADSQSTTSKHKLLDSFVFTHELEVSLKHILERVSKNQGAGIFLKGNYGSHTLRKTFGYHQRVTFGRGIPELMVVFNHSSQRETLSYLCIQPEEVKSIYLNEL